MIILKRFSGLDGYDFKNARGGSDAPYGYALNIDGGAAGLTIDYGKEHSDHLKDTRNRRMLANVVAPGVSAGIAEMAGGKMKHHAIGLGASLAAGGINSYVDYNKFKKVLDNSKNTGMVVLNQTVPKGKEELWNKTKQQFLDGTKKDMLKRYRGELVKNMAGSAIMYGGSVAAMKAGKWIKNRISNKPKPDGDRNKSKSAVS